MNANLKLYAPENGYVQAIQSNVGDYINPQDEILLLLATGETMVVLNAFEKTRLHWLLVKCNIEIQAMQQLNTAKVTQLGKVVGTQGIVEVVCVREGSQFDRRTICNGSNYLAARKIFVHSGKKAWWDTKERNMCLSKKEIVICNDRDRAREQKTVIGCNFRTLATGKEKKL